MKPNFEGEGKKTHFKLQSLLKLNTFDISNVDPTSKLLQNLPRLLHYFHDYFKTIRKILQDHLKTTPRLLQDYLWDMSKILQKKVNSLALDRHTHKILSSFQAQNPFKRQVVVVVVKDDPPASKQTNHDYRYKNFQDQPEHTGKLPRALKCH